jgi:hypothetical protein
LPDEQELIKQACANGFTFGVAGTRELARMKAAVEPVHEQLSSDRAVAAYLDEMRH